MAKHKIVLSFGSQGGTLLHFFGFPVHTYVKLQLFLHNTHAQAKRDAHER